MTLAHLLDARNLRPLSGGPDALKRPVRGVHSTEMDHPTLWVERGWVVLTSGLALRRRPDKQRALIAELDDAGVTALGFGIGSAFSVVPRALLDEARRRDFPIFVIPWDVSFRDMIRDVYEELLSDDVRGYLRLASMQHHLLDALADESPLQTVIGRLGSLVDGTVAVVGPGGRVIQATGALPARAFWDRLSGRTPMVAEFDVDGWHGVGVPLPDAGEAATRWLVIGTRRPAFSSPLTKRVAQITAPLLAAMSRIDAAAQQQERRLKAALLDELLDATPGQESRPLQARAGAFGIGLDEAERALVLDAPAVDELEASCRRLGMVALLVERDGRAVAVAQPAPGTEWGGLLDRLGALHPGRRLGAGRPIGSVADVRRSHRDALMAMRQAAAAGVAAVSYEQLDVDALLVGDAPPDRWIAKVEALVEPLREHEPLREALAAYFAHDLDSVEAAKALHLHPNSLRYRLRRVEALLGRPLRRPSTIAALRLAQLALGDDLTVLPLTSGREARASHDGAERDPGLEDRT